MIEVSGKNAMFISAGSGKYSISVLMPINKVPNYDIKESFPISIDGIILEVYVADFDEERVWLMSVNLYTDTCPSSEIRGNINGY